MPVGEPPPLVLLIKTGMDTEPQMGIVRCHKGHAGRVIEKTEFRDDALREADIIRVVAGFLGNQDIGVGGVEGLGETGLGRFRVSDGWIEVVQDESGFGTSELKNHL